MQGHDRLPAASVALRAECELLDELSKPVGWRHGARFLRRESHQQSVRRALMPWTPGALPRASGNFSMPGPSECNKPPRNRFDSATDLLLGVLAGQKETPAGSPRDDDVCSP
jgi:hypothetical protein